MVQKRAKTLRNTSIELEKCRVGIYYQYGKANILK